jgi:hypothetical protein
MGEDSSGGVKDASVNNLPHRPDRPADAGWLSIRMPADDKARAAAVEPLIGPLVEWLETSMPSGMVNIVDLGAGTGSNAHWLAPRLPFAQHWTLVDHDAHLLSRADPPASFTGRAGKMEDVGRILAEAAADHKYPTALLTCSALLDVLTAAEVEAVCTAAAKASCAVLFSLSVTGNVSFSPMDPLDAALGAAFNEHQRAEGRLGPDAPAAAEAALRRQDMKVRSAATDWELDSTTPDLFRTWLEEWVRDAVEQDPGVADRAGEWLHQRREQLERGELTVRVAHRDILALPG